MQYPGTGAARNKEESYIMRIGISADSTCDLSPEIAKQYEIEVIPQPVIMGGRAYRDGVDIRPAEIFAHVAGGGEICSTSAVNVAEYTAVFERLKRKYDAVIHFNIGSAIASCHQNACIAAGEIEGIYAVDSMNLSVGIGYQAVMAARLASQGLPPQEIVDELKELRARLDMSFVIDKLEYLKKGGRCSSITAFGANLLNIKPAIAVKDGVLQIDRKYRGSFKQCVRKYIDERLSLVKECCASETIFLVHAACSSEVVELAEKTIAGYGIFDEILTMEAGCTVSCHCGPNTLGILYAVNK